MLNVLKLLIDMSIAPTEVKVLSYSATTAMISWMPSDSNFSHTVYVDDEKFQQVPPSNNQCNLVDLKPDSIVTVKITAIGQLPEQHVKMYNFDKSASSEYQFRTDRQGQEIY